MEVKFLGSKEDFDKLINQNKIIVSFYTDWCGACSSFTPILEKAAKKDVNIVKVNADEFSELAQKFNVRSIPASFIFKNGIKVDEFLGIISEEDIVKKFNNA